MSTRHLASLCMCISLYYFSQGACLFRVIHLEVYSFIPFIYSGPGSRRILTSTTSIFWAIIVDHVFMYSSLCICISLVLFDPWSVLGLHHTQFMKTRPKDADSSDMSTYLDFCWFFYNGVPLLGTVLIRWQLFHRLLSSMFSLLFQLN